MDPTTTPLDIQIDRDDAVRVEFEDGTQCTFPVEALRAACPCAGCRGTRERGAQAWPRSGADGRIAIRDAQLNGAWGLSIDWSDGHSTGIYAWEALRRWWDRGMAGGLTFDMGPEEGGERAADSADSEHR